MKRKPFSLKGLITSFYLSVLSFGILNAQTVDITYQGEDFTSTSGCYVGTYHSGYTGAGYINWVYNGWAEWNNINMPGSGTLTMTLRYANGATTNRVLALTVNSVSQGNVTFAPTGAWTSWSTVTVDIPVNSGSNTIRFVANSSSGPNIDYLQFTGTLSGGGDTEAPSVPTGLSSSAITETSFTLSWTASTDNVGVTGYEVFKDGASIGTTASTSISVTGLTASTTYSMTVRAQDAVPNWSAQSAALQVTTAASSDTEAPSVPTGLTVGTITSSSVALSWNASTDNVGVTDYKVYTDGSNPVTVTGASATITGLAASTSYSFTVSAIDAASNESAQSSSVNATTSAASGVTSSTTWQSFSVSTETGAFTATFDAVPNGNNIDALTGILNGTASAYGDVACIIRFNTSGQIDARNGGTYDATNTINYTSGTSYHFRVEINVPSHTYYVYVTPQGSAEQTVASNFAFRSEQAAVTQLTGWTLYGTSGTHTVSNMAFETVIDTQAPSVPTGLVASDITSVNFTLSWTASTDNIGVTGYEVFQDGVSIGATSATSMLVTGLTASTTYAMTVRAQDAAPNWSAQSTALNVTTDIPDTQAPSVPTGLTANNISSSNFTLSWTASTDNVGVTGYEVFQDGVSIGITSTASMYVSGLGPETTYAMTIRARDVVPNWSAQSSALNVTTIEGDGFPDATTTGPSGTLTNYSGNITANTNGQIIQNLNINGNVYIEAHNVTIRNCIFKRLEIAASSSYTNCVVEDCILDWAGRNDFTLRRCEMRSQSADLVRINGPGNVLIEDCYLHVDGPRVGLEHSDIVQEFPVGSGTGLIMRHNRCYIAMEQNSVVISVTNMLFENNLVAGGSYPINASGDDQVINNRFSTLFYPGCGSEGGIFHSNETNPVCYGNVWHETGAPVNCPSSGEVMLTETIEPAVDIYPNPLNGNMLNIQLNDDTDMVHVNIYDLTGRSVYNQLHNTAYQTELSIPVDDLSKGIYIVSVNGEQQKLVIE